MKTLKYIFTIVMLTLVANSAFAQFSFDTKKCKYTQLAMVNKSEWSIQPNGEFAPKSENALLYQKAEKCSGWYIQPGAFASIIDGSKFAPKAEIIFGYDFCCGHSSNIAVSLEAKAAFQRFESENYDDLTMIKATYTPTFGGNVVLHLSKHCKTQFAIYGGAGYTRLSSDYATPEDGTYLKNVSHNTMSYEAGAQAMWRCKLGTMIGVKAGYNHTYTNHISQGMFSVGVVVKLKKVYKSRAIKYSDYVNQ